MTSALVALILLGSPYLKAVTAALGGAAVTTGTLIVAQAALPDFGLLDEIFAGTLIAGAGLWSLRIVLRASAHERETASENEARLNRYIAQLERRAEDAETDAAEHRARSRRLLLAYDRERAARISLEQAGIAERRQRIPELEAETLLEPGDLEALGLTSRDLESPPGDPDTT